MENYVQADDYELWTLIENGPNIPMKEIVNDEGKKVRVPKSSKEYDEDDFKAMEKNARAMKLLIFGLGPEEYQRVSTCDSAKEIWDSLSIAHEGTTQVKQSRIELLMRQYELFSMDNNESIQSMFTRFTLISNELNSLGRKLSNEDLVRKILRILPQSWENKVIAIQEAKDLTKLSLDELLGNLQTHELMKNSQGRENERKDKGIALNAQNNSEETDDEDLAMAVRRFKKFYRKARSKGETGSKRSFN